MTSLSILSPQQRPKSLNESSRPVNLNPIKKNLVPESAQRDTLTRQKSLPETLTRHKSQTESPIK